MGWNDLGRALTALLLARPPGGPFFNLFNLGAKPEDMKKYKKKEIENGRLVSMGAGQHCLMV